MPSLSDYLIVAALLFGLRASQGIILRPQEPDRAAYVHRIIIIGGQYQFYRLFPIF